MEQFKLIAKTLQGLEEVLAQELTELGAQDVQQGLRVVTFLGDKEMMYKANFCLRTALRILKPIKEFKAGNADEVYDAVKEIDWCQFLTLKTSFAVDSVVYSEDFRHSKFVAYKVKDAIVDFFREKEGQRPNISVSNPDIRFNIHISGNDCTLSLDSSGESLHKRGFRVATVESPINEVLAAGMIRMTGWAGECDFIDPMCGSGTIAIEAAMLARNIYPGIFHSNKYAFENWPDFDSELLQKIYNDDSHERKFEHRIYARDIEPAAVNATTANARSAGVLDCMEISQQPFQQFKKPEKPAIMVMNPPYGERVSSPNLLGLYRTIGEKLKHQFTGNEAWVISYREETFDQIGLKPSLRVPLFNGSLECEFRKYQIFDGKLKTFRSEGGEIKSDDELRQMSAKRSFRKKPDFAPRYDEEDNEGDIPAYLMKRHRDFVASQKSREGRGEFSKRNEERYGRGEDRYGGGEERYGRGDEHYGRSEERKGRNNERYNRSEERYDRSGERYGRSDERHNRNNDGYGLNDEGYNRSEERYGRNDDRYDRREGFNPRSSGHRNGSGDYQNRPARRNGGGRNSDNRFKGRNSHGSEGHYDSQKHSAKHRSPWARDFQKDGDFNED